MVGTPPDAFASGRFAHPTDRRRDGMELYLALWRRGFIRGPRNDTPVDELTSVA